MTTMPQDAARLASLKQQYSGRWGFFRYLTGLGFSIYNTYKNHFEISVYQKLFIYLLKKDGFQAQVNAPKPIFWNDEDTGEVFDVPFLVNGNVIVEIFAVERIDDTHRERLKNMMKLAHIPYGMICNFDRTRLYTEKYVRDGNTGIIDRI